jgi:subtilisin-like proprotein convertase family protein
MNLLCHYQFFGVQSMKRIMILCCLLAAVCVAFAGQSEGKSAEVAVAGLDGGQGLLPLETAIPADIVSEDIAAEMSYLEVEILNVKEEITRLRDEGIDGTPELWAKYNRFMARWAELEGPARNEEPHHLDQGGSQPSVATVITLIDGSYCVTGVTEVNTSDTCTATAPHGEVWYTFTAAVAGTYRFTACGNVGVSSANGGDVDLRVWTGVPCAGASSYSDLNCGGWDPRVELALTAGQTVLVELGYFNTATIPDPYRFQVHGPLPTTGIPVPANDLCTAAIGMGPAFPDTEIGTTRGATQEGVPQPPVCNWTNGTGTPGVWYTLLGNNRTLTASTNELCTAMDTRIKVFRGTCAGLVCVVGQTDISAAPGNSLNSVSWCSKSDSTYFILVSAGATAVADNGPFTLVVSEGDLCVVDCQTIEPCGLPAETEPNDTCGSAGIQSVAPCGESVYGTVCAANDRDYWYVPPVAPGDSVTILLFTGANCDVFPPVGVGFRFATGAGGVCVVPAGTFFAGGIVGGTICSAGWPGGWIAIDRLGEGANRYRLETRCDSWSDPCTCADLSGIPNVGQECFSCVGKIPASGTSGNVSYNLPVLTEYHITDLDVCVTINHTFDGDVSLWLVSPWGDSIKLFGRRGGSGDNIRATFDDEAITPISAGVAPFNGPFIPEEPLAAVDGNNALGTWQLAAADSAGGDSGYVFCICLNFSYDYILSAELNAFSALPGDNQVTLNWSTASETNNDRFEIMRDGVKMTEVDGQNSVSGSNYAWTDANVTNGTTYSYTLVAVNIVGTSEELGTVNATPNFGAATVTEYALHQNYPNPFNPSTSIAFDMVEAGFVNLSVYNLLGQQVATVVNGSFDAGRHVVTFDATGLASGLYMYKIEANGFSAQKKLLLMK